MNNLAEWLLARIAEDEEVARAAVKKDSSLARYTNGETGPWMTGQEAEHLLDWVVYRPSPYMPERIVHACSTELAGPDAKRLASHIARWDPARVLAECAAKREILALHATQEHEPYRTVSGEMYYPSEDKKYYCECQCLDGMILGFEPCETKQLLALPYADEPGYLEEWRP